MNKRNYQRELDDLIKKIEPDSEVPSLLLHSAVRHAAVMYWNICPSILKHSPVLQPNIYPESEYRYRVEEQNAFHQPSACEASHLFCGR